jgi:hypothetical protein
MSDSEVEVQFGGDASGALASMSQVRHALMGLTEPIRGVYDNLGELAEAFAAAFAIEKIAEFVEKFAEMGEQINRTAAMIGASVEQVQVLGFMAKMTGGNAESLAMSMQRFELAVQRAQNPTSQQAQALKVFGLNAKDLIGIPFDQQMKKFADAVSRFADGPNKTAALAALNRGLVQMIPVLDQGAEGWDNYSAKLKDLGELTKPEIDQLEGLAQTITMMGAAFSNLGGSIVAEMAPAFKGFVQIITDLVAQMTRSIQQGGIMKYVLDFLTSAISSVDVAFAAAIGVVEAFWDVCVDAAQTIASIWNGVGRIMYDVFTFKWSDVSAAWTDFQSEMQSHTKQMITNITGDVNRAVGEIKTSMGFGPPGETGGAGKPQAPATNVNAAQDAGAAQKAIDAQIKVLRQGLAAKKAVWAEEVKTYQITQDQEFGLLESATEREYQAELALLKKELEIGNQSVEQKAAINAKIKELEAKHNTDMVKLDTQSVEAQTKLWDGYFSTVEGAFNSHLKSLLAGTETWHQAMGQILGDLVIKFIEGEEAKLAHHLATEIGMTTATQTGAAAREAAETSANSGSILVSLANAVKSIFGSAGQTSAGVSAAVAPVAGPAAPAIGAAAGAAVLSEALPLVPHAVGSWEVGGVTPALLHPGEMVIPQTFAEGLRNAMTTNAGGGGGNTAINLTVSAWDGASVQQWLRGGGANVLAKAVTQSFNNNPSLRPSYQQ